MEWKYGQYKISNDKSILSIVKVCKLLSKSYWANERSRDVIIKSIENSLCYGVYLNENQIGFGRVITDYSTTFYICDVILEEKYRGIGLGKKLIECMMQFDDFSDSYGILATRDAHGLYQQYGFINAEKNFMHRMPNISIK